MKLLQHQYGKVRVRVMKVIRNGDQHSLKELAVSVLLTGDFAKSYTAADNRLVVPTDTMKNSVYLLAKDKLGQQSEEFGLVLVEHFLATYRQVERVEIGLAEHRWERLVAGGRPHAHSFVSQEAATLVTTVTATRDGQQVESGIKDLRILKTTGSGFENFFKDKYTTLADARDRILATKLNATWIYEITPKQYSATNAAIVAAMLDVFANQYSPSVQATLFQMGEAALKAVPEISKVTLALPNQHCLLVNLAPFGVENANEVFVPTDEPHGVIEGTVSRD